MKQVGTPGDPNLAAVQSAAHKLGEMCESVVFAGGCAAGLLITAPRAQMIRATQDVDVVVELVTITEYYSVEKALRQRGFVNDQSQDAPVCRWKHDELILDVMPTNPEILGFGNPWYPLAVTTAENVLLPDDTPIRLITTPVFVATKLEAFHSRGNNDYLSSHDLEDIVTVIDGCPALPDEIDASDRKLQRFLQEEFSTLLSEQDFLAALPGYLPGDAASQARLPALFEKIQAIAESSSRNMPD